MSLHQGHLLLTTALLHVGCSTSWMDPMEEQKKYKPFEENPLFADGRAMRPLVEGTVSREQSIGPETDKVAVGSFVEEIPQPITRALLETGKSRYAITCAPCHGTLGDGDSVVAQHMLLRPPPSLLVPPVSEYPPGRIFHSISLGYGLMPSYAAEVPADERWAVVAFLAALKRSQNAALSDAPPDEQQRLQSEKP